MAHTLHLDEILNENEVKAAIRKLGWLSSFSRRTLLSRFLLRSLATVKFFPDVSHGGLYQQLLLMAFKPCIHILSAEQKDSSPYAAPYEPSGSPTTFYLSVSRQLRFLSVSIENNITAQFGFTEDFRQIVLEIETDPLHFEDFELQLLAHEIREVGKNVNLFNKRLGDQRCEELREKPLWRGSNPLQPSDNSILAFAKRDRTGAFDFWNEWYQGILDGALIDLGLQRRVALIEDAIWEAGPEAVAEEIERVQAEMLAEKLPMAERIEVNPDTGKFRAIAIPVENPTTLSALLSQIEDALEDCLGGHNGLVERSGNVKKLSRVLTKYKDDPQNAELTLTRVAGSLRSQLHDTRELPDNEDNLALLNAVEEGVRGIRANHPEVANNREQLAQQAFQALAPEDKELLQQALPVLAEVSEPELAEDFEADIPELINDALLPLPNGAPPLPNADATTRVFSRVSKMAIATEKGAQVFDSKEIKTARLAHLGYTALDLLYALVQVGLRILGVL